MVFIGLLFFFPLKSAHGLEPLCVVLWREYLLLTNEVLLLWCTLILQIFQYDDKSSLSKDIPALEIKKLQEQNANLRAAIAQMRKEMESLNEQMLPSLPVTEDRQLAEQGDNSFHRALNSVKEA